MATGTVIELVLVVLVAVALVPVALVAFELVPVALVAVVAVQTCDAASGAAVRTVGHNPDFGAVAVLALALSVSLVLPPEAAADALFVLPASAVVLVLALLACQVLALLLSLLLLPPAAGVALLVTVVVHLVVAAPELSGPEIWRPSLPGVGLEEGCTASPLFCVCWPAVFVLLSWTSGEQAGKKRRLGGQEEGAKVRWARIGAKVRRARSGAKVRRAERGGIKCRRGRQERQKVSLRESNRFSMTILSRCLHSPLTSLYVLAIGP